MEWRKMRRFNQQLPEEECIEILKNEPRGVMAIHGENGYPYAFPLDFYYDESDGKLYFHGAKQGNKVDLLKQNNKVSFCVMDKGFRKEGEWPLNIRSVIIFGHLDVLEDPVKIEEQARRLGLKYYPTPESVQVELDKALSRVHMTVLTIDYMTGKIVNES
jgi:nitroimidazol reductase NimA-like FMN-containing flavoprotein (pyridoxamine 5'-phosphate oxidase superfamily)